MHGTIDFKLGSNHGLGHGQKGWKFQLSAAIISRDIVLHPHLHMYMHGRHAGLTALKGQLGYLLMSRTRVFKLGSNNGHIIEQEV